MNKKKMNNDGNEYLRLLNEGFRRSAMEKTAGKILPLGIISDSGRLNKPESQQVGIPPKGIPDTSSPITEGRSPLPFLRRGIPAIETARGILSKEEPQGRGVIRGGEKIGGEGDLDGEVAMAKEAITKGTPKEYVGKIFRERTGQELR